MDFSGLCTCSMVEYGSTAILLASCLILIIHYKSTYSYWEKQGIKGPRPLPIVGNMHYRLLFEQHRLERGLAKRYGKLYGVYQGSTPQLVISDPEILRQICIKDFEKFPNHKGLNIINKYQKKFLINLRDDNWRKVRALMSPTFTSGKMRRMFKLLDTCAEDLILCIREQLPKGARSCVVNVKDLYSLYTMNAIATCCYGLKLERSGSANLKTAATRNVLVRYSLKLFEVKIWVALLTITLPDAIKSLFGIELFPESNFEPLARTIKEVINTRRKSAKKIDDYLQLLLDANLNNRMELDESDTQENHHAGLTKESILEDQKRLVEAAVSREESNESTDRLVQTKYALTDIETLSNAMFLMMVGLETTGTMLSNCTYALAFHQEIQQKLYEEVRELAKLDESKRHYIFDYENLTSCIYLDAVISETLRSLTNVVALDRDVSCDYYIEKYNVTIKKGSSIILAYFATLNDPDYWEEPKKFNPDRFLPENRDKIVPGAYCPFGLGPRHCIGMRFSLTESKLALAKILMNFRFEPAPDTSYPPKFVKSLGLPSPNKPLVKLIPREILN